MEFIKHLIYCLEVNAHSYLLNHQNSISQIYGYFSVSTVLNVKMVAQIVISPDGTRKKNLVPFDIVLTSLATDPSAKIPTKNTINRRTVASG